MSNMSYCRFENTLPDLRDCWDHWFDKEDNEMSETELRARKRIQKLCKEITEEIL